MMYACKYSFITQRTRTRYNLSCIRDKTAIYSHIGISQSGGEMTTYEVVVLVNS